MYLLLRINPGAIFVLRHNAKMLPFALEVNDFERCSNEQCFLSTVCFN